MAKIRNPQAPTFTRLTATGTITGYFFVVTSANATVGATYTNNGNTFTVLGTIAAGTQLFCSGALAPTASGTLTKSSGTGDATITFSANQALATYTTPANAVRLKTRQVAGGGGGGSGAGTGGFTLFGIELFICAGGVGGGANPSTGGSGGSATIGTLPFGATAFGLKGGGGGMGAQNGQDTYGIGGNSMFAGAGTGASAGAANTGGGGGGGGPNGCGGGAGAYIEGTIPNPAAIYYYSVALGGTAGGGYAGATGQILIEEQYS